MTSIALVLPLVSGGRLSRVCSWPARPLLPALFRFPSLSFYFTHLQPDGLLEEMEYSQTVTRQHPPVKTRSHTYIRQALKTNSQAASYLGTSLRVYEVNYNGGSASERAYQRRPTPLETQEKTTETETHSSLATLYACTVNSRQILDANQSD